MSVGASWTPTILFLGLFESCQCMPSCHVAWLALASLTHYPFMNSMTPTLVQSSAISFCVPKQTFATLTFGYKKKKPKTIVCSDWRMIIRVATPADSRCWNFGIWWVQWMSLQIRLRFWALALLSYCWRKKLSAADLLHFSGGVWGILSFCLWRFLNSALGAEPLFADFGKSQNAEKMFVLQIHKTSNP